MFPSPRSVRAAVLGLASPLLCHLDQVLPQRSVASGSFTATVFMSQRATDTVRHAERWSSSSRAAHRLICGASAGRTMPTRKSFVSLSMLDPCIIGQPHSPTVWQPVQHPAVLAGGARLRQLVPPVGAEPLARPVVRGDVHARRGLGAHQQRGRRGAGSVAHEHSRL